MPPDHRGGSFVGMDFRRKNVYAYNIGSMVVYYNMYLAITRKRSTICLAKD